MSSTQAAPKSSEEITAPDAKKRRLGPGGCMLICIGLVVMFIGIPVAGLLVWSSVAKQRVNEQLEAIRAKGEPTSPEELGERYAEAMSELQK